MAKLKKEVINEILPFIIPSEQKEFIEKYSYDKTKYENMVLTMHALDGYRVKCELNCYFLLPKPVHDFVLSLGRNIDISVYCYKSKYNEIDLTYGKYYYAIETDPQVIAEEIDSENIIDHTSDLFEVLYDKLIEEERKRMKEIFEELGDEDEVELWKR
jgi:hypothetical protein